VEDLREFNPMLGHRGCRLGITYPEITEMQARAIVDSIRIKSGRIKTYPEIMIPSYWYSEGICTQKNW
jgi:pyruvate,orthophosphate dikinase